MTKAEFIDSIIAEARAKGYVIEDSRNGRQIDFGHKKLHEKHLAALYPSALNAMNSVNRLIEEVAPGRSCSHKPMRLIIEVLLESQNLNEK